jgi:hypothetical protein
MMFIELINAETNKRELFNVAYLDKITDLGHGFIQIGKSTYGITYNKFKNIINEHHAKNTLEKINQS